MNQKPENKIATQILDKAFLIHRELGPGLLESVYEKCLAHELAETGHDVKIQVPVPLVYKTIRFEAGFRIDLLVDHQVLVEIKSVEKLAPVHFSQVLTYLKLTGIRLGLLINFNVHLLKEGVHRVVNRL